MVRDEVIGLIWRAKLEMVHAIDYLKYSYKQGRLSATEYEGDKEDLEQIIARMNDFEKRYRGRDVNNLLYDWFEPELPKDMY